jgi:hypothetical protein
MQETVRKNAGALVEILNRPDDLDEDVAEARDALISELVDDPYAAQLGEIFRQATETKMGFMDVEQSATPTVYYQSGGNPEEVEVGDWPTTSYRIMVSYNPEGRKVEAAFSGNPSQVVFRLEELPSDLPSEKYEAFSENRWTDAGIGVDAKEITEANDPVRQVERLVDSLTVDLETTQTRYIVDMETNEIVLKHRKGERDFQKLTEEDL